MDLPADLLLQEESPARPPDPIRAGGPCPSCGLGRLDYNGLLELECPRCGYRFHWGAGCT